MESIQEAERQLNQLNQLKDMATAANHQEQQINEVSDTLFFWFYHSRKTNVPNTIYNLYLIKLFHRAIHIKPKTYQKDIMRNVRNPEESLRRELKESFKN